MPPKVSSTSKEASVKVKISNLDGSILEEVTLIRQITTSLQQLSQQEGVSFSPHWEQLFERLKNLPQASSRDKEAIANLIIEIIEQSKELIPPAEFQPIVKPLTSLRGHINARKISSKTIHWIHLVSTLNLRKLIPANSLESRRAVMAKMQELQTCLTADISVSYMPYVEYGEHLKAAGGCGDFLKKWREIYEPLYLEKYSTLLRQYNLGEVYYEFKPQVLESILKTVHRMYTTDQQFQRKLLNIVQKFTSRYPEVYPSASSEDQLVTDQLGEQMQSAVFGMIKEIAILAATINLEGKYNEADVLYFSHEGDMTDIMALVQQVLGELVGNALPITTLNVKLSSFSKQLTFEDPNAFKLRSWTVPHGLGRGRMAPAILHACGKMPERFFGLDFWGNKAIFNKISIRNLGGQLLRLHPVLLVFQLLRYKKLLADGYIFPGLKRLCASLIQVPLQHIVPHITSPIRASKDELGSPSLSGSTTTSRRGEDVSSTAIVATSSSALNRETLADSAPAAVGSVPRPSEGESSDMASQPSSSAEASPSSTARSLKKLSVLARHESLPDASLSKKQSSLSGGNSPTNKRARRLEARVRRTYSEEYIKDIPREHKMHHSPRSMLDSLSALQIRRIGSSEEQVITKNFGKFNKSEKLGGSPLARARSLGLKPNSSAPTLTQALTPPDTPPIASRTTAGASQMLLPPKKTKGGFITKSASTPESVSLSQLAFK